MDPVWIILSLIAVVVAFVVTLLAVVTIAIARVHWQNDHLPGPPYNSFFLGHLPPLRDMQKAGKYTNYVFLKWAEEYGPCFKVYIMHRCLVWVTGAPMIKELLTKSKYIKSKWSYTRLYSVSGVRFLGVGLLTEIDHYTWHKRRVIINPAFHKRYLMMFMSQFNSVADRWIEALTAVADGKTVFSMHEYLCRVTLDAIAEVGFNHTMNATGSGDDNPFVSSILTCLKAISKKMKDPIFEINPLERDFRKSVQAAVKFLRDHGRKVMEDRVSMMSRGEQMPEDILTFILKCRESNPSLTKEDLLDDFLTLFLAGQETTSNALSFMMSEVGRHPDIMKKMQEEVDSVMGSRSYVEYDDVSKLEYCGQAFKETLRLYPPAPGTSRENVEEVVIDGFRIPAHSMIILSFFVIHRMAKYYEDPDTFRPERFAPDSARTLFTYMPFSLGQRSCIGQQFALIEAKILMCKFLHKFEFKLDENQVFDIVETATLRPKGGTMMSLKLRSHD